MAQTLGAVSTSYTALVEHLALTSPNYKVLNNFLNSEDHISQSAIQFTVATIISNKSNSPCLNIKHFSGATRLEEELSSIQAPENCRLYIVENVCAKTIALLGTRFDIDPQFFVDHLNNEPWYRIENVADRIPALPSSQKLHDFLQLRYIEATTISNYQYTFQLGDTVAGKSVVKPQDDVSIDSDARSFMHPDETTTRIPRKAGKLIPRPRKGRVFESLLCTRQVITVWFQKGASANEGWIGVILVDPPFKLPPGGTYCTPTGHRSFNRRASVLSSITPSQPPPSSSREAISLHLFERFSSNTQHLQNAKMDCFFLLGDIYRLVASNWVVINEYVNREMATIEYILEKEEPSFRDLETYFKDLYIFRRRCTKYHELIHQTRHQCQTRGQPSWPHSPSPMNVDHATDMENDFRFLENKVRETGARIEKNINLLTALVAIGEGKQALDENHGIIRLNLLATIFLPFSTVATILGMQGQYAPGAQAFWLFWAVAVPLTAAIVLFSVVWEGVRGWVGKVRERR